MRKTSLPNVSFERNHCVIAVALGFLAGCRLSVHLRVGLWLPLSAALCVTLGLLLRRAGRKALPALFLCALMLGAYACGQSLSPAVPNEGSYEISGSVCGEARLRSDSRVSFTLCDVVLNGESVPCRAYCSYYYGDEPPSLFDGAALRFTGRAYHPDGKSGEPHSDFRMWMLQNGTPIGIAISREITVENTPETAPVKDAAYRVRSAFSDALERTMGDGARVAMAMLFSDRDGMTEDETEAFRTLGVAHVMSVSGLHVGLLGGLLIGLLSRLRLRRAWQLPIVAAFLVCYCALTGFSAASMRAAVMMTLLMTARALGRKPDPLTTLAAAMLAVLLIDPLQAFSASFALSFSSVACITLLYPAVRDAARRVLPHRVRRRYARRGLPRRFLDWLRRKLGDPAELVAISLSAQLGVMLPTAIYFHRLPLYGVFINLLVVPYVGLLVPLFALALLLSPVPIVGAWVGALASLAGNALVWAVGLMSRLPYASVRVASAPAAVLCCAAMCMLIFSRRMRGKAVKRLLAAGLCVAIGLGCAYLSRPPEKRYIQLAVGQADAALLMDGDQTVAIDVGSDGAATLDYLLSEGRDLDALILTHLHYDHAGGVELLLRNGIRIKQVYLPKNAEKQRVDEQTQAVVALLRASGVPISELARGDELRYNDTVLETLWPVRETVRAGQDANELPLALAIRFGGYTILNASDLSGLYERFAAVPCDVLKVAHHGSKASTSDAFLSHTRPSLALVSCSSGSKTLPSAELLSRLSTHGIPLMRTDLTGDVTLTLQAGRLCATPYKARRSQ